MGRSLSMPAGRGTKGAEEWVPVIRQGTEEQQSVQPGGIRTLRMLWEQLGARSPKCTAARVAG